MSLPIPQNPARAILLMVFAILIFTAMDAAARGLVRDYPPGQVIWVRFLGQFLLVVLMLNRRAPVLLRTTHPWLHVLRALFQVGAIGLFFLSLRFISLAEATAIGDTAPVLITLGAALFLGERLGARRLLGIAAALVGVVIITRPGAAAFSLAALLPFLSAVSYTGNALLTRALGLRESVWTAMLWGGLAGAVFTSLPMPWLWTPVAPADLPLFAVVATLGTVGQLLLIRSFTLAEASVVAPYSYLDIVFATLWGITLFDEWPDLWTVTGALVIMAAGLYVWHRTLAEDRANRAPKDDATETGMIEGGVTEETAREAPVIGLRHRLEDRTFRLLMGGLLRLPYRWRVPLGGWLFAHVVAPLAGYRRRIRDNLALVLPDLPRAEVRRLERAVPDNIGRSLIEFYSGPEFVARAAGLALTGDGAAALETAHHAGRPVVLVTAHFGNYEAARAALLARGYRVGGLYMEMSNKAFNSHYVAAMERIGTPVFARGRRGMAGMIRFLRQGGMLGMLVDQHMPAGARLGFFGHEALTALSAAELALKHDALLVPVYALRQPDGLSFRVIVEAPVPHGDPVTMTRALNDSLEALVRAHMDQWFWIHRRWKGAGAKVAG